MFYDIRIRAIGRNQVAVLLQSDTAEELDGVLSTAHISVLRADAPATVRGWWMDALRKNHKWVQSPTSLVPPWKSNRVRRSKTKDPKKRKTA